MNQRQLALLTGVSLLVMTIVAGGIMGCIYSPIFDMEVSTFQLEFEQWKTPLLLGIIGWVVILITDLIVSWTLFRYYQNKNFAKAVLMGSYRVVYSLILFIAIIQLIRASFFAENVASTFALIKSFQSIWQFGLIIFGFHLLTLAPLVCERRTIRMVISAFLFIAGFGYLLSNTLDLFITDYETMRMKVEAAFILPMVLGELGLAIWLLVKGGKEITSTEKQYACVSC